MPQLTAQHSHKYRTRLPQLDGGLYLSDGGLETTLVFLEGWDLPSFASFVLHETEKGRQTLAAYFSRYIDMALGANAGFILESATWRANPDWGAKLGYDLNRLERVNRAAIELLAGLRQAYETAATPIVISGNVGPRGDGYDPGKLMSISEAEDYHAWQIGVFGDTAADVVSAFTMTNVPEAAGFARAAASLGMPCVVSFTVETDGRLPSGHSLEKAIRMVDEASAGAPAYYMINCAHPTHFQHILEPGASWLSRVRGLRANSSRRSHAELDNASDLDAGNPDELAQQYAELRRLIPNLNVLGGCCGTDDRHVRCISHSCRAAA